MEWRRIDKSQSEEPTNGTYRDWKPQLATEGEHRCVYCSIHDNRWGGERIFHVEHFKPKSKFKALINSYANLFYACPVCNVFKSDSWFDAPVGDWTVCHYPDPSEYNYGEFFVVDVTNQLTGVNAVGKFLIERLHLNRKHLIIERRKEIVEDKLTSLHGEIDRIINLLNIDELRELAQLQNAIGKIRSKAIYTPMYEPADLS
ncbi:MAG: HNH endonuclease [Acidobacteria bacterium]|nr:HNH endonuclease [Acidobacteriota bacterium]